MRGGIFGGGWRFLLVGGLNTLLTFLLYQLLLYRMSASLAWAIAWASGLVFISVLYPKKVFKEGRLTPRRFSLNIVYYLISFLISLGLLALFVHALQISERYAGFLVLVVTVPLNFFFSRVIFTARQSAGSSRH